MKILNILLILFLLTGCTVSTNNDIKTIVPEGVEAPIENDFQEKYNVNISEDDIDINLTTLSSTMVFGEVYDIVNDPKSAVGKTIKLEGRYSTYNTGVEDIHVIIITDATACCAQGLEFILKDGLDYPPLDTNTTIYGEFEIYEEDGMVYSYRIKDAVYTTKENK